MTKQRCQRTDVEEAQKLRKVMSTSATGTANGSTGRSTKGAQSVHLASGGTAGRGTACRDSGTTTAGTGLPVAGEHVPIMHLTASLPAPTGVVPKHF